MHPREKDIVHWPLVRHGGWHKAVGIALTLAGMSWFAKRAGWMPTDHAHPTLLWPLVTLGIGLFLVFRVFGSRERDHDQET